MLLSDFYGNRRVWFGPNALEKLPVFLSELGIVPGQRLLLIVDAYWADAGLPTQLKSLLDPDFSLEVLALPPHEPKEDTLRLVAQIARLSPSFVAVIGVGGGSALDMAKFAALVATNPGDPEAFFRGSPVANPPIPVVAIPSTAGTGAEVSRSVVASLGGRKASVNHPGLVPVAAVLDPTLTVSVPKQVTVWTGLDALSHCIEALLSTRASPLTDAVALQGIRLILRYLPICTEHGGNLEARSQMQVAAYLGGLALAAGMVVGHSIAHTLSNRFGLPHGLACALALPACVAWNASAIPEKVGLIGEALGLGQGHNTPAKVVQTLQQFISSLGVPTAWREMLPLPDGLDGLAEECVLYYPRPNNPRPLETTSLAKLYEAAYEGNLEAVL